MFKDNKLKKLKRKDLLEILLLQNSKINKLEEELIMTKKILNSKKIMISKDDTKEEALLKLNKVFELVQKSITDYIQSIEKTEKNSNKKSKQEYNKKVTINNKERI